MMTVRYKAKHGFFYYNMNGPTDRKLHGLLDRRMLYFFNKNTQHIAPYKVTI